MEADEAALRRDCSSVKFAIGARKGKWRLEGLVFPYALFCIAAKPLANGPSGFLFRSECKGYSAIAPTSQLWHGGRDQPLEEGHRPQGAGGVMKAFSSWKQCLYHPIDRQAWDHNGWNTQYPWLLWNPNKDITFLLETIHDLLHCSDYSGASLPAEALNVPAAFVDKPAA